MENDDLRDFAINENIKQNITNPLELNDKLIEPRGWELFPETQSKDLQLGFFGSNTEFNIIIIKQLANLLKFYSQPVYEYDNDGNPCQIIRTPVFSRECFRDAVEEYHFRCNLSLSRGGFLRRNLKTVEMIKHNFNEDKINPSGTWFPKNKQDNNYNNGLNY